MVRLLTNVLRLALIALFLQMSIALLNIIVCAKVVLDPEAPISTFRIDPEARRAIPSQGIPPVISPYDENCLEAALKIKEVHPSKISVLSMGRHLPVPVLKKSLAVGADELVVLDDDLFEDLDSYSTAHMLAHAIRKLGAYDLILTGRMASDTNAGQVGLGVAELLGIPCVTIARKVEVNDGKVLIERARADGYEVVEAPLPCLVTVSHEIGELRSASIQGLMSARKQPFITWTAHDLAVEVLPGRRGKVLELYMPRKEVVCQIIEGETPEAAGVSLAVRLRGLKLI